MITVLVHYERISLFHTMEPFFSKKYRKLFTFVQSPEYCLKRDRNKILFMERWFKNDLPPDLGLMEKLRDKYRFIVFFDGYAAAGTHLLEVLPYVDRLFHKSIFTDSENYRKDLYSKRLFSDYYHREFGIKDTNPEYHTNFNLSSEDAKRVELSWSIGLGDYPRHHRPQRVGVGVAQYISPDLGRCFRTGSSKAPKDFSSPLRSLDVHSRVGLVSSEAVAHQRKICLEIIAGDERFATGVVPQKQYYRELEESKIIFSPFGWGEVCFRDFEAVFAGAMLLKPDMSHLKTYPDVYIPYETYIPVKWDGSDLLEKTTYYLDNNTERMRIAKNAWDQYQEEILLIGGRLESIFQSIMDL